MPEVSSDLPHDRPGPRGAAVDSTAEDASLITRSETRSSTLIEFPGTTRVVPEWRKQLNQRVREVQELRAREAAEAAAVLQANETVSCSLPSAQLELVPDREAPVMNPIVSKALERLERAHRSGYVGGGVATAAAAALEPTAEGSSEPESSIEPAPKAARKSKLVVVPPKPEAEERKQKPVRVISDGVEDAALSYLETCLTVPVIASHEQHERAGVAKRMVAGVLDLLLMALLVAPFVAVIEFAAGDWNNPRTIAVMSSIALILMFSYLTISIALTGRTPGMRLLSLRTIDVRTGLIPTGGQSMKRAAGYILSLAILGLGIIYALIDRDGRTIHDRLSKTEVVQS